MTFHSLDFVVFFLVTLAVYWRLPHSWQNRLLLVASYVFYGYVHPWFLALIATSTTIDYAAALAMERDPTRKRLYLGLSIASNMGMLGFFKYFNFFVANVSAVLRAAGLPAAPSTLAIFLPVGISFFTFQALSYTIDVYRGQLRARRSLIDVATFVAFFPQLVAGPIERASHLLPQVESHRRFSLDAARTGLLLMAWGFFKKLVVADSVGVVANKVFGLQAPSFHLLWVGVFAFGLQIYADFSAYSDIARGTARWFGIELMANFDHPYLARGPRDFWRRWHISLSTWFRDYVYIPLGGSRLGFPRELGNIVVTFTLSGLWHGASWNFVLWGVYHGLLLVASRLASPVGTARRQVLAWALPLRVAGTFVLVHVGWLLFRETEWAALVRDLTLSPAASSPFERQAALALLLMLVPYALPLFAQGLWVEWRRRRPDVLASGPSSPTSRALWLAWQGLMIGLLCAAILVFRSRTSFDFIYFQF